MNETITDLAPIRYRTTRAAFDASGLSALIGVPSGRWMLTGYSVDFRGDMATVSEEWAHSIVEWNKDLYPEPTSHNARNA